MYHIVQKKYAVGMERKRQRCARYRNRNTLGPTPRGWGPWGAMRVGMPPNGRRGPPPGALPGVRSPNLPEKRFGGQTQVDPRVPIFGGTSFKGYSLNPPRGCKRNTIVGIIGVLLLGGAGEILVTH